MPDQPFISRELDRRIASAEAAIRAGKIEPAVANTGLMPWAAAEAWLEGDPCGGISPRDRQSYACDLCPLDQCIAALTRARDALAKVIDQQGRIDLVDHWRGMADAVRRLERQRDWTAVLRSPAREAPPAPLNADTRLPPPHPSLLADMFGPDGSPLPANANRQAA